MPRYIRHFLPGATYFFTVTLADRSSTLLVAQVDRLRAAYALACAQHPFDTLAICVLPDHLHAIWRLPPDDADAPLRWRLIKRGFSRSFPTGSFHRAVKRGEVPAEWGLARAEGGGGFGEPAA